MSKSQIGNFFEDFTLGQIIEHAAPRTISSGEMALYQALYGSRFVVQSSAAFASAIGYPHRPVDDLLVFHTVFGKSVPDISLNAIANLGYAECRFLKTVYEDDTLTARSEVIGLKENSNGETGVVYVRTTGSTGAGDTVLEYVRWVMVRKRDKTSPAPEAVVPELAASVRVEELGGAMPPVKLHGYDTTLAGSPYRCDDYEIDERIDHIDGMTVEEADHMTATRLYQNTSKVHFNQLAEAQGRFGRRIVYGGHVMSIARALSFNGLANAFHIAAINSGRHTAPLFAGETIFAWSQVTEKSEIPGRSDIAALRIVTTATKDRPCHDFPGREGKGFADGVILELDYWVVLPR